MHGQRAKGWLIYVKTLEKEVQIQDFFYNCFIQINGVEDKLLYVNELYKFGQELNSKKRKTVIINGMVSKPLMEEISAVNRKNYQGQDQMLSGLAGNLVYPSNITLQQLMVKAFLDIMIEESKKTGMNINKLTNKGVYLVCWMKRYRQELFAGWKEAVNSCFIHMGGCKDSNEALFFKDACKASCGCTGIKSWT